MRANYKIQHHYEPNAKYIVVSNYEGQNSIENWHLELLKGNINKYTDVGVWKIKSLKNK